MKITASRQSIDAESENLIRKLDPVVGVDAIKEGIQKGTIHLYGVRFENDLLGIFLSRIELLYSGKHELVIMYAVAKQKTSFAFTSILNPFFEQIAKTKAIKSIRIHSQRRGMDKILEKHGYEFFETIFIKRLD